MTWDIVRIVKEILISYLYSSLDVQMTEASVKQLRLDCALCPAFHIVSQWSMTWSTKVALVLGVAGWAGAYPRPYLNTVNCRKIINWVDFTLKTSCSFTKAVVRSHIDTICIDSSKGKWQQITDIFRLFVHFVSTFNAINSNSTSTGGAALFQCLCHIVV